MSDNSYMPKIDSNTVDGYIDHLGIVHKQDSKLGYITIDYSGDLSYIPPTSDDDEVISILNNESTFRPIRCSELYRAINNKAHFKFGMTYGFRENKEDVFEMKLNIDSLVDNNENKICLNPLSDSEEQFFASTESIPLIKQPKKLETSNSMKGIRLGRSLDDSDVVAINSAYNNLYDGKDKIGFDLIKYSANNGPDLGDEPWTACLVSPCSDVYTDTLNLNGIMRHNVTDNLSGTVDLDVRYSVRGNIYTGSVSFSAFTYDSDKNLTTQNIVHNINNFVQVEYINGVLRVFPLKTEVIECIINNCIITYAKF